MSSNKLQKAGGLYDQLKAQERATLVLEALARGDEAEADRLGTSCPRSTYTQYDADWMRRMEASCHFACVVAMDLKEAAGRLFVLEFLQVHLPELIGWTDTILELAYERGKDRGQAKRRPREQ